MAEAFTLDALDLPQDSEIRTLLDCCPDVHLTRYSDGEYLMREGEDSLETFLVVRGSYVVEQQHEAAAHERGVPLAVVAASLDDPSFIGEMAYLDTNLRTASVRASGPVHALVLKPAHVDVVIESMPFFSRVLSRQFAQRLREANNIIKTYRRRMDLRAKHVVRQPGETLAGKGERATTLFQLVDGTVTRTTDAGEEDVGPRDLPEGFLNARAYFVTGINDATLKAKAPAIVVGIDASVRDAAVRNFPNVVLELLAEP